MFILAFVVMTRNDRGPRSSNGIEKTDDRQGLRNISVTHTTSHIHDTLSRSSPVLTHFSETVRTSPVLTRFSLFTTEPPSYSSLTHALRSVGLLHNQNPDLVPVPDRPFDCVVSDSRITHALWSVGLFHNQTPGLVSVPVRPFGYSV